MTTEEILKWLSGIWILQLPELVDIQPLSNKPIKLPHTHENEEKQYITSH